MPSAYTRGKLPGAIFRLWSQLLLLLLLSVLTSPGHFCMLMLWLLFSSRDFPSRVCLRCQILLWSARRSKKKPCEPQSQVFFSNLGTFWIFYYNIYWLHAVESVQLLFFCLLACISPGSCLAVCTLGRKSAKNLTSVLSRNYFIFGDMDKMKCIHVTEYAEFMGNRCLWLQKLPRFLSLELFSAPSIGARDMKKVT